jgi:twinkle protein
MNWTKYDIDPQKVIGGKTYCPRCSATRKHKRDRSLSVDLKTGLFNCHNTGCDFRGCAVEVKREKKEYTRPPQRLEKLSKKSIEFFEQRGISNNTTLRFGITEAKEWMPQFEKEVGCICFNYQRKDELVNIKFRGPQKSFKMVKGAELIFYNLDSLEDQQEAVIVEGEMDCLTLHECGIFNSVSVPNGASMGNQKLEYLDNCIESFEGLKSIILAVDGDAAGLSLREELARRLGKDRCFTITYPEGCKDSNEVLLKYGVEAVKQMIADRKQWPIEGVITMDEMYDTICNWYQYGYPQGAKTKIPGLDHLLTFAPGQLTIMTGIPGHGKDEYCNWITSSLSKHENWRWGICGFEEEAEQTVTKIVEKHIGKSFDFRRDPAQRISVEEFEQGIGFVDAHYYFFKTESIDTDVESLLAIGDSLVTRYGIQGLVLNPWNWIENTTKEEGTNYVNWALGRIIRFARQRGVHVILIAHTTKMQKDKQTHKYEVPNLYSISGSAHFYNKCHNGITVYRDEDKVDVYIQKVKQSWLGQKGFSTYEYDTFTRQYSLLTDNNYKPLPGSERPLKSYYETEKEEV